MLRLLLIGVLATTSMASAQTEINWKILGDVSFIDKYSEEVEAYYYYPHFGPIVRELDGQEVYIRGYMLPINPKKNIYILSKYPYASCFFCGNGGPESIIELKLRADHPDFRMDQIVTIKGRLKLNQDDIYQCNYILEDATVYNK